MCTNYVATQRSRYAAHFAIDPPAADWPPEIYRDYAAPFIRRSADGGRESLMGTFGIRPRSKIKGHDFDTMNARSETVGEKVNFKDSWLNCRLALLPADVVFEPRYPTLPDLDVPNRPDVINAILKQKSERWGIRVASGEPFAVAGFWRRWPEPDEGETFGLSMLTVNADDHPVLRQFHRHLNDDGTFKEKRGVVILRPDQYDDWLNCEDPEVARTFLTLLRPESYTVASAPKTVKAKMAKENAPPTSGTLF
ncbi:SOS response-associated peptidase family protein [Burkholderia cepacia]|uniref:DUF159 family protein n=2 Tax=Burkholderia cepacia TaxID=292 RepID=A0ABM6NYI3_BURCE|nr:SOS response-associated peptidase family protein [Burkholderia cepacia]AIO22483.1 hypothetical protein DM41_7728 [Burkholderia cepacia ATCC 25416]ALK23779.1 hypothetical protein APZ15_38370 [Burkholderia cepacia ATCC 25416]ASE92148.1 DUF159 family protein [Burkholderia cepacia]ATF79530.1 DUF159 family protein [Burkholderia cepacia]MCA7894518.1 SOS response-associated peptidase [Burkholderia cepacia]